MDLNEAALDMADLGRKIGRQDREREIVAELDRRITYCIYGDCPRCDEDRYLRDWILGEYD